MNKRSLILVVTLLLVCAFVAGACGQAAQPAIVIGVNAPLTGDIPKVGEGSKFAAEMWLEDINAAGGLEVGGKKYPVELVIEDNESKAESATKANTKLITQDEVLVIRWTDHTLVPPQGHYVLGRLGYEIGITPDTVFDTPLVHPKGGLQLRMADGTAVDSLAWGSGPSDFAEGGIAPAMGSGSSLERAPGGEEGNFVDTDNNGSDFAINQSPNPQNSGSALTPVPEAQLRVSVSAPETAEPGNTFEYTISVTNETSVDLSDLTVQLPIPLELAIPIPPTGVTISDQATYWGMPQINLYH